MTVEHEEKQANGVAPAAGCFGFARGRDDGGHIARTHVEEEPCDRERYTARFGVVDYGDGQPVPPQR